MPLRRVEPVEYYSNLEAGLDLSSPLNLNQNTTPTTNVLPSKGGVGESILSPLGLTPEHNIAVANMQKNPAEYGIGSQFDYAAESTKDMVNRASNPLAATISAVGNVVGRPVYDFIDAAKEYSKKGYQGEFSFTPQGAIDFAKNLGAFGKEFYAQKPHVMMAGAAKGGLEALAKHYGFTHAMADDSGWTINYPDSSIIGQNIQRPNIAKLMQMSRRRQQLQNFKNIEAAEAAKKRVITTTPKGPPSITQKKTKPKVTGPTYGPHGGSSKKSSRRHKAPGGSGYGPHKKADGGLINFFKNGGFLG